jgi:hypothetical protein
MAVVLWLARDLPVAALLAIGAAVYAVLLVAVGGVDRRTLEGLRS